MSEQETERTRGTVRFFDVTKGYGFCKRDDGQADVFLHASTLKKSGIYDGIKAGDTIEIDVIVPDGKGPKAAAIRMIERIQ